jgi:hypothetical protein
MIGHYALDDPFERVPGNPEQRPHLALGHLLGAEAGEVFEVPHVADATPRPRHRLDPAGRNPELDASELALEARTRGSIDGRQVQMPTTTKLPIVHPAVGLAAHRAGDPPTAQAHRNAHSLAV